MSDTCSNCIRLEQEVKSLKSRLEALQDSNPPAYESHSDVTWFQGWTSVFNAKEPLQFLVYNLQTTPNSITGSGSDSKGPFTISGGIIGNGKELKFLLIYDEYTVEYSGILSLDKQTVTGTYQIQGPFNLTSDPFFLSFWARH